MCLLDGAARFRAMFFQTCGSFCTVDLSTVCRKHDHNGRNIEILDANVHDQGWKS
jgi:hypothetical protein